MKRRWLVALAVAGCAQTAPSFKEEDFKRHVEFLASPELKGRDTDTPEGVKAAEYVAEQMKAIGLRPGGTNGYYHDFTTDQGAAGKIPPLHGRNVVGILEGTDLKDEIIVVNAHHDHLGVDKGKIRPGADDNASGVAMILELARAFAKHPTRRTLAFVSFDAEEKHLIGSREFVKAEVLKNVVAEFCYDLIGGNFFSWETTRIYAMGGEHSPEMAAALARHSVPGLEVRRAGIYVIMPKTMMGTFARSDYDPYRKKKIPFVFFSTGTPWYYHTSWDVPANLNYTKMSHAAQYCYEVISDVADSPTKPTFSETPAATPEDAVTLRQALERVLAADELVVTDEQKKAGRDLIDRLSSSNDRKTVQDAMIFLFLVQAAQVKVKGKP